MQDDEFTSPPEPNSEYDARQQLAEQQQASSGKLTRKRQEHERKMKAMRKQQGASATEVKRLRALATAAGIALPEQSPALSEPAGRPD